MFYSQKYENILRYKSVFQIIWENLTKKILVSYIYRIMKVIGLILMIFLREKGFYTEEYIWLTSEKLGRNDSKLWKTLFRWTKNQISDGSFDPTKS